MVTNAMAATQAQIDTARNKGLAWLFTHQNGDGSWRSTAGTEVVTTATALEGLSTARVKSYSFAAGVSWLSNAEISSVDSLARAILAAQQAGLNVSPLIQKLLVWRNGFAAWGTYDHFTTSFPDTPLALSAIRVSQFVYADQDLAAGLCAIVTAQKTGDATVLGSWGYLPPATELPSATAGAIAPTANNLREIDATRVAKGVSSVICGPTTYTLTTVTNNGIAWLLSQRRNAD